LAYIIDRFGNLSNVFLDEVLGSGERTIVEFRRGDISQVANKPRSKKVDQLLEVVFLSGDRQRA
jgi:hypothetical protein